MYNKLSNILSAVDISTVIDVGANSGHFGKLMREMGHKGTIISFEPISNAFSEPNRVSAHDDTWHCYQIALGNESAEKKINISANSMSSSLLVAEEWTITQHPSIEKIGTEIVKIRRLDEIWHELPFSTNGDRVMLKLDVQGFEPQVLEGAGNKIFEISLLLLEAGLVPTYQGAMPLDRIVAKLRDAGFLPVWIDQGWRNEKTGQVFECDVAFAPKQVFEKLLSY